MEFVRGYTKIDNSWWSEGGPFARLTPDEQTILLYLATITIRKLLGVAWFISNRVIRFYSPLKN